MQIQTEVGRRNHVQVHGTGKRTLMMAHGFGCDQNMWRFLAPEFTDDYRHLLPKARHPILIVQSREDSLAALPVGEYMHKHLPDSEFRVLDADGHCTHMTHPDMVADAIQSFLKEEPEQ